MFGCQGDVICTYLCLVVKVMFSRTPAKVGGTQQSSGSRRQEREIRKLRGELQHETQKFQNLVHKYQKELEDVSNVSWASEKIQLFPCHPYTSRMCVLTYSA